MSNVQVNIPSTAGAVVATKTVAGVDHQKVLNEFDDGGSGTTAVSASTPLPVTDAATEASLASIDGKLPAGGLATSAKQDTGNTSLASIDSKLTNPLPVSGTVSTNGLTDTQLRATPVPVSNTNLDVALSTRTKPSDQQHTIVDSGTLTAVTAITNALPAGANLLGKTGIDQTTPGTTNKVSIGTDGTVTVNPLTNSSIVKAQLQDNAGAAITVGQKVMATSVPVVIASDQSAVPISGTVTITPSGTQDENIKQVNGATVNVGVGAAGTGTQRVAVASDSSIATVTAVTAITNALPAGTNVIGHVIADTGSTTAVTGNVTVVQGTGTNLHTVIDSGTLTAVTAITNALPAGTNLLGKVGIDQTTPGTTNLVALTAETTKVIGVVRSADGIGNLLTSTGNALDVNIKTPATLPVSIADGINVVEGAVADAIVAAGATGTLSAKLRRVTQGLEDLKTLTVLATGANIIGKVGIDQTTNGTTNKVVTDSTSIVNIPQTEGKWIQEIMLQVLIELRIQNQYMSELPLILAGKSRKFDEPSFFRNDQSIFVE